jgi:hypothetical protein
MADVFHRTKRVFLPSVNTPEYDPVEWIINPAPLPTCDRRYWKAQGDAVVEMTTEEKAAVDAEIVAFAAQEGN